MKHISAVFKFVYCVLFFTQLSAAPVKHVILFIGDGMGYAQVELARRHSEQPLVIDSLPIQASVTTHQITGHVTDSAAAGTAMATGRKVHNGVISLANPGDSTPIRTIAELAKEHGLNTGAVTTVELIDATPAAFLAHAPKRNKHDQIAHQILNSSRPKILLGADGRSINASDARKAGYHTVQSRTELRHLLAQKIPEDMNIYGGFGDHPWHDAIHNHCLPLVCEKEKRRARDIPSLAEMTELALHTLEASPKGFFLLIEQGSIDKACHHLPSLVELMGEKKAAETIALEVLDLDAAVAVAVAWAKNHPETAIIVTADHETGGLVLEDDRVEWTAPRCVTHSRGKEFIQLSHTGRPVPLFAQGIKNAAIEGTLDNTDIAHLITSELRLPLVNSEELAY